MRSSTRGNVHSIAPADRPRKHANDLTVQVSRNMARKTTWTNADNEQISAFVCIRPRPIAREGLQTAEQALSRQMKRRGKEDQHNRTDHADQLRSDARIGQRIREDFGWKHRDDD